MEKTIIVGCEYHPEDLTYVRLEELPVNITFESGKIFFYTRVLDGYPSSWENIEKDRKQLMDILGSIWSPFGFGIHTLQGGPAEVIVTSAAVNDNPSPAVDDDPSSSSSVDTFLPDTETGDWTDWYHSSSGNGFYPMVE